MLEKDTKTRRLCNQTNLGGFWLFPFIKGEADDSERNCPRSSERIRW